MPRIDAHFWDWTLWLGAKQLRGHSELVATELVKMWHALLEPIGAVSPPRSIADTIGVYTAARSERERELGVRVSDRLEKLVRGALMTHGVTGRT